MWPLESTILFACVQLERTIRFILLDTRIRRNGRVVEGGSLENC